MMRLLLLSMFFLPLYAWGQDIFNFLSPVAPSTSIELEGIYHPLRNVDKGRDKTQLFQRGGSLNQRVYRSDQHQVAVGARYNELDLSADDPILKDYYSHQVNLSYKRSLPDDLFWLATVSYGSASDRPFKDSRDNTLSVNYIQKFNQKWFGALNFSNNRTFLNNIPLPGFFYVKEMTRESSLIIGFPFIFWLRPINNKFSFRYFGLLPWTHQARILYRGGRFTPYIGYSQSPLSFFRHDRQSDRDRVFWFERRIGLGSEIKLSKGVGIDFSGGWAFDREFYEARNFSQEKENHVRIDNSYFIALDLRINL